MSRPRAIMLAARLDRGGVADHVKLLSDNLSALGYPTNAATPETIGRQPEWIGLHFVCYAWARQGILRWGDIEKLKSLCTGSRVAVYLHELWIGESTAEPFKNRIIGLFQRRGVIRMLHALAPEKIFTNTPVYQTMLAAEGLTAEVLPLPGNIPLATERCLQTGREWLDQHKIHPGSGNSLAAVFGTIHREWQPFAAMGEWVHACHGRGQKAVCLTIGRHGPAGEATLARLQSRLKDLRVVSAGEQPAEIVAGLLACCNFGWATSPWALIGKSGSAAAFLESGLPVVVTRNDWQWRRGATPAPFVHTQLHLWESGKTSLWEGDRLTRMAPSSRLRPTALVWSQLFNCESRA